MFFKKRRLIADHEAKWIADQFSWFFQRFDHNWLRSRRLILPTSKFFSAAKGNDHNTALAVFAEIKSHMGLGDDWPCELEAQEPAPMPQAVADSVLIQPGASPINGTFRMTQTGGLITYDPDLLASPKAFIATMVHELSHYAILTQPARAEWETEPMLEELVTDLFVIASGFGIFKIESITNASAFQSPLAQGWSISHAGYISPELAAVALAFYLRLNDQDPDLAKPHLSGLNQKRLTRALHQLDRDAELLDAASPR